MPLTRAAIVHHTACMTKMGLLPVALVLLTMTSGCPPQVAPRDAYVTPRADAFVPLLDAGPPTCIGTPASCVGRTGAACTEGPGCRVVQCTGSGSCGRLSTAVCVTLPGCYVDGGRCMGTGRCEDITFSPSCYRSECTWDDQSGPCGGTPTRCESLTGAACAAQPGCTSLLDAGPIDAGPLPDAGRDGGRPDAGPRMICAPPIACDPFSLFPCPGSSICIPDVTFGTACVPPASMLQREGAPCSFRNACDRGLACLTLGSGFACQRLCRIGDSVCGAGLVCGLAYDDANPCLRICMPRCDLYAQDCPAGLACVRFRPHPIDDFSIDSCMPEGTTPIGSGCTEATSCVRGAACIDSICQRLCRSTADCTSGTCVPSSEGIRHCE